MAHNLYSWRWSVEASSWIVNSTEILETSLASGPDSPRQPFSMSAGYDTTPPGAITNLSALTGDSEGEIRLSWSAPGDDGYLPAGGSFSGVYAIQYSTTQGDFQVEDPNDYSGGFDFGQIYMADDTNNIYFLFHNWDPVSSNLDFSDDAHSIYLDIDNNDSTGDTTQGGADRRIIISRIGVDRWYAAIKYCYWSGGWQGWNWRQEDNNPTEVNGNQSSDGSQTLPKDGVSAGTSCGILEVSLSKSYNPSAQVTTYGPVIAWHIAGNDPVGSSSSQYLYTLKNNVTRDIDGNTAGSNEWVYTSWSTSTANITISTTVVQGELRGYTLTGLVPGATYYIRIWTRDDAGNWSSISNGATAWAQVQVGDTTPPGAITNLSALTGDSEGKIRLSWSAPGDDGYLPAGGSFSGVYAIQYSTTQGDFQVEDPNDYSGGFDFGQIYMADDTNNIYFLFHNWDPVSSNLDFSDDAHSIYLDIDNNDSTGDTTQGGADRRIIISRIGVDRWYAAIKYCYWSGGWQGWDWRQEDNNPTEVNGNQSSDGSQTLPKDGVSAGTSCGILEVSLSKSYNPSAQVTTYGPVIAWHIAGNDPVGSSSSQYLYTLKNNVTRDIDGNTVGSNEWVYTSWSTSTANITISTTVVQGELRGYTLTGLVPGATYYIRIWTRDDAGNWSSISNGATAWAQVQVGDTTPPGAITNLSALTGDSEGKIRLSWSAPGDDGWSNNITGGKYRLRWSTYVLTDAEWSDSSGWTDYQNRYSIEWDTNTTPSATETRLVTGLIGGVTYYFRIWTRDENINNWSSISNGATAWAQVFDIAPPATVTLYAGTGPYPESVKLYWNAPGDDGNEGTLPSGSQYKIQIATHSAATWDRAYAQITISTSGVTPGTQVEYIVTGLAENVTFYFRLWTADEIPNWSAPSNIASANARVDNSGGTIVSIPDTVMVVYSEGSNGVRYRTLTPGATTWSSEQPVPPVNSGRIYWAKIVACPIRDEKAMITLDSDGNLKVSTYSEAGGWANSAFTLRNSLTNSPASVRWFDICYEQVSGDLMVVYSTGSNVLAYRTFNGTNWSSEGSVGNLTGGSDRYPYWVSISPKPNSDEILLAYTDDKDRKCYGSVWNGSSWGNHIVVWNGDVNGDSYRCSVAVSYQWANGVGVVVHANTNNQIVARQWNGSSWGSSTTGSAGTIPQFLVLKPNPNTNEIMVFYGNSGANTFAIKWNGSSWGSYTQIDNQGGSVHAYPISGESEQAQGHSGHWISLSNQANVIGENGGLRSDHYNGISWSIVQKPVHNTGNLGGFKSVMTTSLPNCTTVYALAVYQTTLYSLNWIPELSTWTTLVALENDLNAADPNPYISFWMTPNSELIEIVYKVVPDSVPPAAVSDLRVSIGELNGQEVFFATWTAPGDNGNEYILHEPSQFRIQYSSNTDILWHHDLAQVTIPISIWGISPGVQVSTIIVPSQPIQEGVTYYFYMWSADETPNWSEKSNQAMVYIPKTVAHTVYYDSTDISRPKWRKWKENEALSFEFSLPSIPNVDSSQGANSFYRMATSPAKNEAIAVVVSSITDGTTRIFTYRFNGSSWVVTQPTTDAGPPLAWSGCVDVAYEQHSGTTAMVVYRKSSGSNILKYVLWNGNQWSSESDIAALSAGISWVKLYPKPQSKEIIAVAQTFSPSDVYAFVWDGNSWTASIKISSAATTSFAQCFDGVYESLRKQFILVTSSINANGYVKYTIWDSSSWLSESGLQFGTSNNPLDTYTVRWIKLAAKQNSNEVMLVVSDGGWNIGAAVWNGTSWSINTTPMTTDSWSWFKSL